MPNDPPKDRPQKRQKRPYIPIRSAPPDDPMFKEGTTIFSRPNPPDEKPKEAIDPNAPRLTGADIPLPD